MLRNKRPARRNIGIDRSVEALDLCLELAHQGTIDHSEFRLLDGDALKLLPSLKSMMSDSFSFLINQPETLIYADPPYMMETRKGGDIYDFEMDDEAHECLLDILTSARCMMMISGYPSPLYDVYLMGFYPVDYMANTRRGMVAESLWMNFPPSSSR